MVNNTGKNDSAPEQQNKHQPASVINHVTQELWNADSLKEKFKNKFNRNCQYYIERELKDCVIPTKAIKKIELNTFKTANKITSTHVQSTENISLQEINYTIFSCKEVKNEIRTPKQEKRN